mmetsp:Transcript_19387/g.34542  ORF Transcript_19387/g.34542 Transcript_19387/m.34542 type:complete len:226 (+) Transcript_19387:1632-2309(+)
MTTNGRRPFSSRTTSRRAERSFLLPVTSSLSSLRTRSVSLNAVSPRNASQRTNASRHQALLARSHSIRRHALKPLVAWFVRRKTICPKSFVVQTRTQRQLTGLAMNAVYKTLCWRTATKNFVASFPASMLSATPILTAICVITSSSTIPSWNFTSRSKRPLPQAAVSNVLAGVTRFATALTTFLANGFCVIRAHKATANSRRTCASPKRITRATSASGTPTSQRR